MTDDLEPLEEPLTISEVIARLESIKEEHGDLPVVSQEEAWTVYANPEYKG